MKKTFLKFIILSTLATQNLLAKDLVCLFDSGETIGFKFTDDLSLITKIENEPSANTVYVGLNVQIQPQFSNHYRNLKIEMRKNRSVKTLNFVLTNENNMFVSQNAEIEYSAAAKDGQFRTVKAKGPVACYFN